MSRERTSHDGITSKQEGRKFTNVIFALLAWFALETFYTYFPLWNELRNRSNAHEIRVRQMASRLAV